VVALARALELTQHQLDALSVAQSFRTWLSVRDACPVGRAQRYSDEHIEYHYTKARDLLEGGRK
jgi:methylmalonic aciduria homocystinuria type C protein